VSRLFISHSSSDNIAAIAFKQWLGRNGWSAEDVFLDLQDIGAGERWKEALRRANARCEAVLLLASPEALSSPECLAEVRKAEDYGKEIIVVLLRDVTVEDGRLAAYKDRQIVDLSALPQSHVENVTYRGKAHALHFNSAALERINDYLVKRGITPDHFSWPPRNKPNADPFPGLASFTEDDAGIFFGRDTEIIRVLDKLRILRRDGLPRVLAITGASGAGKSSFLRAGVWPRLTRDPDFAPVAILRPANGVLTGPQGLGRTLAERLSRPKFPISPGYINARLVAEDHAQAAQAFVRAIQRTAAIARKSRRILNKAARSPALLIGIDQAEELLAPENAAENDRFLFLIATLLLRPPAGVEAYVLLTVRAESADRLFDKLATVNVEDQSAVAATAGTATALKLEAPETVLLPPLAASSYREIILKPLEMLARRGQRVTMEPALTEKLVEDTRGADALPLLAFTLAQLYQDYSTQGKITLRDYQEAGGVAGAISKAVAAALARPGEEPSIPTSEKEQNALLRTAFIPALARVDPQSGAWTRRVARLDEIPEASRNMIRRFVKARLLVADRRAGMDFIEIAHESLLRQWPPLAKWLESEADNLKTIEDMERAAAQWLNNERQSAWLDHRGKRLGVAEKLAARPDFQRRLGKTQREYLVACRSAEQTALRRRYMGAGGLGLLLAILIGGVTAWWQGPWLKERYYSLLHVHALTETEELELRPLDRVFRECAHCPEMLVIPAGNFLMGAAQGDPRERPQHRVQIGKRFAVAKFELTFAEWDGCATYGDCNPRISDEAWGRGRQPTINISWEDAQRYIAWLRRVTGRPYRLLSETEWEYAARAGSQTRYSWGDDIGKGRANCYGCGDEWPKRAVSVGSFAPNAFGLHDMHGNVWEWVEDCFHDNYEKAPSDGSAWTGGNCNPRRRVVRGGSWLYSPPILRASWRDWAVIDASKNEIGVRIGRTLAQ
jgi:formylglycine-generating enzyme required for sulfatase activity